MSEILDYKTSIKRKLKILKKRPTYERISELSRLIKLFTRCDNIDLFSHESTPGNELIIPNMCKYIENILENPDKYTSNLEKVDSRDSIGSKNLDKILKEKLPKKLYEKVKQTDEKESFVENTLLTFENLEIEPENIQDLLIEDLDSENEEDDEGYSLYEEESDEEENEFSD